MYGSQNIIHLIKHQVLLFLVDDEILLNSLPFSLCVNVIKTYELFFPSSQI